MAKITIIPAAERTAELTRVAAYARVSSSSDDQLNSFTAQIRHYTETLSDCPNTIIVDMYADEGITGTSAEKRDDFQRLMHDCRKGKIDRIITKSVSRFARNTKDCLEAIRELKDLGVSIFFEKENIDTAEIQSEMMLTLYSQFAQEESMSISKNVRMGVHKRMADGTYDCASIAYGYRKLNGEWEIDEEQAKAVRFIYDRFLKGFGTHEIMNALNSGDFPPPSKSEIWHHTAVMYILRTEKYIGDTVFMKAYSTDTFPVKYKINRGERAKYYVSNTHTPLINLETFEAVQALIEKRKRNEESKRFEASVLRRKIVCGECGNTYRRKVCNGRIYWVCRFHDKSAANCSAKQIPQAPILNAFIRLSNKLCRHYKHILFPAINQLQELIDKQDGGNEQLITIKKRIAEQKEQSHLLTTLKAQGVLDEAYFTAQLQSIETELLNLRKNLRGTVDNNEEIEQLEQIKLLYSVVASAQKNHRLCRCNK